MGISNRKLALLGRTVADIIAFMFLSPPSPINLENKVFLQWGCKFSSQFLFSILATNSSQQQNPPQSGTETLFIWAGLFEMLNVQKSNTVINILLLLFSVGLSIMFVMDTVGQRACSHAVEKNTIPVPCSVCTLSLWPHEFLTNAPISFHILKTCRLMG